MAKLSEPHSRAYLGRGVRQVVQADRSARFRRSDAEAQSAQRELRISYRKALHPAAQTHYSSAFRAQDQVAIRRAQDGAGRRHGRGRCRYDGDQQVRRAVRYDKYKESVCHSGHTASGDRSSAQSQLYVRYLCRRRVQPSLPLGRAGRGRRSGADAFQSPIYIRRFGPRKNAYRAGYRHGGQAA